MLTEERQLPTGCDYATINSAGLGDTSQDILTVLKNQPTDLVLYLLSKKMEESKMDAFNAQQERLQTWTTQQPPFQMTKMGCPQTHIAAPLESRRTIKPLLEHAAFSRW